MLQHLKETIATANPETQAKILHIFSSEASCLMGGASVEQLTSIADLLDPLTSGQGLELISIMRHMEEEMNQSVEDMSMKIRQSFT